MSEHAFCSHNNSLRLLQIQARTHNMPELQLGISSRV
jgi:hypothetical protein